MRPILARRSEMVRSTTVKLCERVSLMLWYIPMLSSRHQGKRRTCDCLKGEERRLRAIVQWKCVNCLHWWYFCSAFVRRTILRQHSERSLETYLGT